ncbi:sulfatase-like hydrolase/transferase [Tunturiibacter lichenicola]|uniref:sulfatase-like hydrolase/transferase n=1 Tax=Tunturiibacter lichenicola TaxID=2051959 RepID=UPI0021B236E8|nr:sulfatase-like hydrolase/transferase [Edaphobacter lichenicola]
MRPLTHPITIAFGLANLYLLDLTGPLISTGHDVIYHLIGSASTVIIPVVVYVVLLSALITGLLFLAERPGPLRVIIWSALLLAIPSILLHTITNFSGDEVPDWITFTVAPLCVVALIVVSIFWKRFLPRFESVQPAAATILGFFAFTGVLIFAQLIWNGWQARNLNPAPTLHQAGVSPARHPRIIWIVFDELSYQQLYERRFSGLELPAFDRLAAQSTVFTHAVPTGEYTRTILPSLFTGIPASAIDVSARGTLLGLRNSSGGKWSGFQQHQTVFQDAINAGYTTGLAGWYNPYCRILPEVLDHCFWTYRESTPANLSPHRSVAVNLIRPFRYLWLDIKHLFGRGRGAPSDESRDIRQHSMDYRRLYAAGDAYLADPSIDFLFLHMPIPHPYGFYDRATKTFASKHTSYVDNLALTDLYLAHVRQLLEERGEWDSATVVVMGDHSWRTSLIWVDSMTWTDEDQTASKGGEFDDRPAYIVKLPNQQTSARIDETFPAIRTRALLDALLRDQLRTPDDLRTWVSSKK